MQESKRDPVINQVPITTKQADRNYCILKRAYMKAKGTWLLTKSRLLPIHRGESIT